MNILLAFKNPKTDDPSACHAGMGVTALNTALSLRESRIPADAKPVANGEYLWAKLADEWSGYTHVVLCAPYIDAVYLRKLVTNYPKIQFAVVYHSNLGFLSVDRFAARSLPLFLPIEQCANFRVAANSAELAGAITAAARVLKNWLTAAVAAMIIQRTVGGAVSLHTSSGRDEGAASVRESLLELIALNPNLRLVDVPWLDVDDFRRYLYGMDLLLQPSFTETFNNVTADGCACGVPSVVSEAIGWCPDSWIAKADSAVDIARVGVNILRDAKAALRGWRALDQYNAAALRKWATWVAR